jgi:hypothetical protein
MKNHTTKHQINRIGRASRRTIKSIGLILGLSFLTAHGHAEGPYFAGAANPFYTAKDVVFDKVLLGRWEELEKNVPISKELLQFEKRDGRSYRAIKDGDTVAMLHLFKLKGRIFIDCQDSTHVLLRVEQFEPTLKFSGLSQRRIGELLREKPFAAKRWFWSRSSSRLENSSQLLASSTKMLRAFLLEHLQDPKLFEESGEYRRVSATPMKK